jgi:hypothetical protein
MFPHASWEGCTCLMQTLGGKPLFTSFMDHSYIPPFELGAFLSHEHSPFSHSNVLPLLVHGGTCVKPWLLCLQLVREPHGIMVGKSLWKLGTFC